MRGKVESKANTNTQAFTENSMVCLSQRIAVGAEPGLGGVDVPDPEVLVLLPELRGLDWSLAGVDDVCLADGEDPVRDIGST